MKTNSLNTPTTVRLTIVLPGRIVQGAMPENPNEVTIEVETIPSQIITDQAYENTARLIGIPAAQKLCDETSDSFTNETIRQQIVFKRG